MSVTLKFGSCLNGFYFFVLFLGMMIEENNGFLVGNKDWASGINVVCQLRRQIYCLHICSIYGSTKKRYLVAAIITLSHDSLKKGTDVFNFLIPCCLFLNMRSEYYEWEMIIGENARPFLLVHSFAEINKHVCTFCWYIDCKQSLWP